MDTALGLEAHLAICSDHPLAFGGLRVAVNVDADTVVHLARCMSAKLACHGVPIGGAKAGIRCSPSQAANPAVVRWFTNAFDRWLRSEVILGKDMGASDGLLDGCYQALGIPQLHLVRAAGHGGCPPRIRDLTGYRVHMTGLGVAWATDTALGLAGIPMRGARAIVQGCGRVGLGAAFRLTQLGARIVGQSDRFHAISSPSGFPAFGLSNAVDESGTIQLDRCDFPHQVIERDALLSLDAEVLVLAADSHVVNRDIAFGIRAPVLVEGANAAILPEADGELLARGHRVVPDIVANSASAALVGHQLASGNGHDPEALWLRIERTIRRATALALQTGGEAGVAPRDRIAAMLREAGSAEPEAV